jgi:hypothetical protein
MQVVWHDDENIQINSGEMDWHIAPQDRHQLTSVVQAHCAVHHFPKQTGSILRADRNEYAPACA